jgi:hypothetical protein
MPDAALHVANGVPHQVVSTSQERPEQRRRDAVVCPGEESLSIPVRGPGDETDDQED